MKRFIAVLTAVAMLFSVSVFAADATAEVQGTYEVSADAQEVTIRINVSDLADSYAGFGIGSVDLPEGFEIKSYSTSYSQAIVAGDYNNDPAAIGTPNYGKLTYMESSMEDVIPGDTYYEMVVSVPANAAGDFEITFNEIEALAEYGDTSVLKKDELAVTVTIVDPNAGDDEPEQPEQPDEPGTGETTGSTGDTTGGTGDTTGGTGDTTGGTGDTTGGTGDTTDPIILTPTGPSGSSTGSTTDEGASVSYSDVSGHWCEDLIAKWSELGVLEGVGGGKFDPDGKLTRAQAAAIFTRWLKLEKTADVSFFTDVAAGDWYAEYVAKCYAAGIVTGKAPNQFAPNDYVTRAEMFTMLCRALNIDGQTTMVKEFADADQIPAWAFEYTAALVNNGYVSGMTETTLEPAGQLTRAQMIKLMDNLSGLVK